MKHIDKGLTYGTIVRVCLHKVSHEIPPLTIDDCIGSLCPQLLILYLEISKENICFPIQKYRVILASMSTQHINHLGPKLVMAEDAGTLLRCFGISAGNGYLSV